MQRRFTIFVSTLLFCTIASADPTVFKMQLGSTTDAQLKSYYDVKLTGINKYSNGNMYSVPTSEIEFEGLQDVTAVFDTNGILVAVLTTLSKSKFDYLHQTLSDKYKLESQNIPFVGNKTAKYRNGDTQIILDAPHLSFEMSMNYIRDDLMMKFIEQREYEERQKQKNEASQL